MPQGIYPVASIPIMKTVSIRLTDKQHYYLSKVAKDEMRTIEHLLWLLIPGGVDNMFAERNYCLKKLDCDLTDSDRDHLKNYPASDCWWGSEYYGTHHWSDEFAENVIADVEGTLIADDASFDLQAEINRTAELRAKGKAEYEAKKAAEKSAECAE